MPSVSVILPSALASAPLPFELHFAHLSLEEQATARKLIHCLNAPIDMPMALRIVETAAKLIDDYGLTLETPTAVFEDLNARMTTLVRAIRAMPAGADELDRPLMRRLTNHSAWALAISLSREERSRAESLAFCLVAFDGILDRASLKSALQALSTRYQTDSHVLVDWFRSKDWLDRRRLSVWTLIALGDRHRTPESEQATENMITDLDQALKEMRDFRGLDGLFRDSHAWLLRVAPGPACSHADGTNLMTPLPRSALARAETKLALQGPPRDHGVDAALGDAIGSYFSASNVASVRHDILDQLLAAARSKDRKKGLSLAISLGRQSRHAAPATALVVAWSIDLMESGTRRTVELSQAAVEKYTRLLVNQRRLLRIKRRVRAGHQSTRCYRLRCGLLRPALFSTLRPKPFEVETQVLSRTARELTRTWRSAGPNRYGRSGGGVRQGASGS